MIKRDLFYRLKKFIDSKEALVVTGMRQVGKTTILKQLFTEIQTPYKLFLDLENVLYRKYFEETNYDEVDKTMRNLVRAKSEDKVYLFLDEIQHVKRLPSLLKYLGDHFRYKFFLTGSVSFYLKNLFSESMAGRKYLFELFPLSFVEFLKFKESRLNLPTLEERVGLPIFETLQIYYKEYVTYGSFPAVALAENVDEKEKTIKDIFSSYYEKEVVNFSDFRKNKTIGDLMLLVLARTGQKLDLTKLSSELGITRITLSQYLSFLEGTYFIRMIRPFNRNLDAEIRETPKIYVCDSGLANVLGKVSFGHLFETAIGNQLFLRRSENLFEGKLNYYQKKSGVEIDFILNKKTAFEVKETAHYSDLKTLEKISRELKLKKFLLVSYRYSPLKQTVFGFQI